jgi:hypothetical protein
MNPKWRCRLQRTFFGLDNEYMEMVYEHFFYLKMHGNWSFQEAYNLPIGLRNWFVNRLSKYFEDQNREMEKSRNKAKGRH